MVVSMPGREDAVAAISIVLADDHEVVRTGLRLLLQGQEGMHVVGEAGDVAGALALVETGRPDVLVLDLSMPGPPSLTAIARSRTRAPS
jgi:two-component system response regulator NreC